MRETPPQETKKTKELLPNLKESYDNQIRTLYNAGVLQILPESVNLGIVGIDGKEYRVPTYQEIKDKLEERKEELEPKIKQGFTKLLLVPLGMPLDHLLERLKQQLITHKKEGKLLDTDNKPLELNLDNPMYIWNSYTNADKEGKLIYYPKSFTEDNHQGKTKQELINEGLSWRVSLVEDLPDLPAQHQGKTLGGRKQLEANKSPNDYLKQLTTEPQYTNEQGFTPEEWITYFLTQLESKNQVIDNYQAKGKASYLPGAYFSAQGFLPCGYWLADGGRAVLGRGDPVYAYSYYTARSSVGVM